MGSDTFPLPYCGSEILGNGSPLNLGACCLGVGRGACGKEGKRITLEASLSDETNNSRAVGVATSSQFTLQSRQGSFPGTMEMRK